MTGAQIMTIWLQPDSKEPGHQRTNCSRRNALQNEGTEYTMNNDVGVKIHFRSLINDLESHSVIDPMCYEWKVLDHLDSRQGFRRLGLCSEANGLCISAIDVNVFPHHFS